MAMFSVTLTGTEAVAEQIREQVEKVPKYVGAAMYQEAQDIMRESHKLVPRDTGTLANASMVEQPKYEGNDISVTLGYGGPAAPYALSVHENPRAGKTGGVSPSGAKYKHWAKVGQWKYLEHPFLAAAKGMAERIAEKVKGWQATDVKA
jgi:hypothetical protein